VVAVEEVQLHLIMQEDPVVQVVEYVVLQEHQE
jgi:hypothetical protein